MESSATLLTHLLPLVPFDGWSDHALSQAAKNAGISLQELKRIFPKGAVDCINYFFRTEDESLSHAFSGMQLSEMRVPERIETLVLTKLKHLKPHREAVRRALAFYALPWNAGHGLHSLYSTVDLIWQMAGDQSLDFNFYTKRATLAGVYSSATLFWLNDNSENYSETSEFLRRRLSGVAAFGKWKRNMVSKLKQL